MSRDEQQIHSDTPLGGRYKIISKLGAGGFGKTFLAEDLHLPGHPQCVVKQLKPQTKDEKSLAMARRLFDTEAQVLYQLGNHDQIPRLLAHFEDNQEFYLAQELVEGEPLTKELAGNQPWLQSRVIALLYDILQVLAFVHEQQVIHRDIKPPNLIRRRQDDRIVLIDFGAVKQVSSQIVDADTGTTNMTISIGTQGYMPNEQLAGTPRFSSDIFAVGMLAIQALTGVHPKRLKEDPKTGEIRWRKHAPHVSPELADILDQMVRYDFRDRYPSATEAFLALQSLPAKLLESVRLPQSVSDTTPEIGQTSPSQKLQPPSQATEATETEMDAQSSTDIWIPAAPPDNTSTSVSPSQTTAPLSEQPSPPPLPESSAPTSSTSGIIHRQLVKPWFVLAALVAVGGAWVLIKTLVSSQQSSQIGTRGSVPTASPSITPTPTPKPKPAELVSQGDRLRDGGDYQKALKLYDQAIEMKPDMAQAYWGRCESLNKLKKPAEAIVACNDALDLKPNYAEAVWSKGNALQQQEQDLQALWLYEEATKLKPDFAQAWLSRGMALQGFGRSVEAIQALDKAIELNRNLADAWSTKGEALWNLGRVDEAIPALDKALQLQPNHPEAKKLRSKAREQLGR